MTENPIESIYGLSPMQAGMLYHKILTPESNEYFLQQVISIKGAISKTHMVHSLKLIMEKYEVLRTAFVIPTTSAKPRQVVLKERVPDFLELDLAGLNEYEQKKRLEEVRQDDIKKGFDLEKDTLLRLTLVRFGHCETALIWSAHHIILDGWCLSLIFRDFMHFYNELNAGVSEADLHSQVESDKLKQLAYGDYIRWLEAQNPNEGLGYWRNLLDSYDSAVSIMPIHRGERQKKEVKSLSRTLSYEMSSQLEQLAMSSRVTLSNIVEAAWGIILQRYNMINDVVFGKVISGRNAKLRGIEQAVGLFINTIPVRIKTDDKKTVTELLKEVSQQAVNSEEYSYCSLAEIQQDSGGSLFETILAFENYYIDEEIKEGIAGTDIKLESSREETNYPISVSFNVFHKCLQIQVMYDSGQYESDEINTLVERLFRVFKQIAINSEIKVRDISLIDAFEYRTVTESFNDTYMDYPRDKTLIDMIEKQAEENPSKAALLFKSERQSYGKLNKRANQLGRRLRNLGVGPDDLVALITERGFEMINSIVAIWKSGGAYIPIAPDCPEVRVKYMLEDSAPKAILTYGVSLPFETTIPIIDLEDNDIWSGDSSNLEHVNTPDDLAYCIYTSGTTGKPKGVLIEHRSAVELSNSSRDICKLTNSDVFLQFASYTFDASVLEIIASLTNGLTMSLIPKEIIMDGDMFADYLGMHNVTHALLPPSYYMQNRVKELRVLITGGAASNNELVNSAIVSGTYINAYGPTECTVYATTWKYEKGTKVPEQIPIGKPVSNTQIYMLSGMELCGIGIPGELCIGGEGLGRGYLHNSELTEEKFIKNPFGEGRLYRTGDLARWLDDGNIEFLGRIDDQVKIRGYRIELQEIESVLKDNETVTDAAVVVKKDKAEEPAICAYLFGEQEIDLTKVCEELSRKLPDYMIPTYMMQIDKLPLNNSGKVDQHALPEIEVKSETEYTAPQNEIEADVILTFKSVLMEDCIGIYDDFFSLGGNSIKAISVVSKLRSMGYNLTISTIFRFRNAAQVAQHLYKDKEKRESLISKKTKDGTNSINRNRKSLEEIFIDIDCQISKYTEQILKQNKGIRLPLSPIQKLSCNMGITGSYAKYEVNGSYSREDINKAWLQILREFSLLSSAIVYTDNEQYLQEYPEAFELPYCDISTYDVDTKNKYLQQIFRKIDCFGKIEIYNGNDISHHVLCVKLDERQHVLLMPVSHLVFDAFSNEVLENRFFEVLYNNAPIEIPQRSYANYLSLVNSGPINTNEKEIIELLQLDLFEESVRAYQNFKRNKVFKHISYEHKLPKTVSLDIQSRISLAEGLYIEALSYIYQIDRVPILLIHSGRNFASCNFSDQVGEFIDIIPMVINVDTENQIVKRANQLLQFIQNHNINISSLITEASIIEKYPEVTKTLRGIEWRNMNIPILNLLLVYSNDSHVDLQRNLEMQDTREDMFVNVTYSSNSLIIDNVECESGKEEELIDHLNQYVGRQIKFDDRTKSEILT